MSLREQLNEDLKNAMRAKDVARMSVIRSIKAAILQAETRGERTTLDDDGVLQVIVKEVKERQESRSEFERGNRPDLVEKVEAELTILETYLPQPLTEDEIDALVAEAIESSGATGPRDMGRVMAWITPRTRGRADGKAVSEKVKVALQKLVL